jgi:hypothetical protein
LKRKEEAEQEWKELKTKEERLRREWLKAGGIEQ